MNGAEKVSSALPVRPPFESVAAERALRAAEGERLSPKEALRLVRECSLAELGRAAAAFRRRLHPEPVVTYVSDRNVNYTNVCDINCRFCAFHRRPEDSDAYLLSKEELFAKLRELVAVGGTQVMLQGGCRPDLPPEWYEELLRSIKREFPSLHLHAFSPAEAAYVADRFHLSVSEVLARLQAAGLDSLPGGGAEILSDRVRKLVSPRKVSAARWLDVFRQAARLGLKGSATMVYGHLETDEERTAHLDQLRRLQDETREKNGGAGVFVSFVLWPMQSSRTRLSETPGVADRATAGGAAEYLRWLALARLFLDNVPHVQASWVTQGTGVGQLSLLYGADDWGGLMMEENVVKETGCVHRAGVAELRRLSAELGLKLRRRDFFYKLL